MKIDWKRKLTSRKLWVSVAGFVAGLIVIFGGSQENADKISGSILSGAAGIVIAGVNIAVMLSSAKRNKSYSDLAQLMLEIPKEL